MDDPYVVKGNCLIIHLDKELDHHLTEQLRSPVDEIIDRRGIRYVIMDFENKSFMDSSGIGFIMGRYKKLAPCKGKIYVANLGRGLERIFKIAGLYTITVEKDSAEVVALGVSYLKIIAFMYIMPALTNIVQGFFRGMGDLKVTLISTITNMGVRVIAAHILISMMGKGFYALAWSNFWGWVFMLLLEVPLLVRNMVKLGRGEL